MTTPYASEAFLHQILGKALSAGASDVHLKVGQPPGARVHGDLVFFRGDKIRPEDTAAAARLLLGAAPAGGRPGAPADGAPSDDGPTDLVFAYEAPGLGRFRVSAYRQRGALSLAMRSIPLEIPTVASLGLPASIASLVEAERGLVLFAGASGSGRSTTAAALVGHVNETSPRHVITFEDPIEHVHEDRRGIVSQRAIGADTPSAADGLRAALRHDPDVLYVADLATSAALEAALEAAELGHLVLAAVAAPDVPRAIARLEVLGQAVPSFATRLADALQSAFAQRLLRKRDGSGLVPACEVLVSTTPVREVLRGGIQGGADLAPVLHELMEKGASAHGTQTFDMHLKQLAAQGVIGRSA